MDGALGSSLARQPAALGAADKRLGFRARRLLAQIRKSSSSKPTGQRCGKALAPEHAAGLSSGGRLNSSGALRRFEPDSTRIQTGKTFPGNFV